MAWLKLSQFKVAVKELVSNSKYSQFIGILQRLSRINPSVMPEEVEQIMAEFLRPGNPYQQKPAPRKVDDIGRARGVGRRKTSTATVWLVEGDGQVMVNGKSIVQVFPRIHDRESALWALRVSERMDKYNVWAVVHGGGVTGQAEATALALARALLVHEPDLKPLLRRGKQLLACIEARGLCDFQRRQDIMQLSPPSSWFIDCCRVIRYANIWNSWRNHGRSPSSREKEAWSPRSQKETCLGQEIRRCVISLLFLSFFAALFISIFAQCCTVLYVYIMHPVPLPLCMSCWR